MTEVFEIKTIETLSIGASIMLTNGQLSSLCHLCRQPVKRTRQPTKTILAGRTAVYEGRLEGIGPVVVKPYRRGGFIRHLNKRHYLKFGPTRCQQEFELLQTARQLGVSTPEPVAFAYCGRLCYLCWLITRGIPQPKSLVQLVNTDMASAQRMMPSVIEQISKLIEHRILHIDLHPGNIIVDKDDRVFIIDFDRGRSFNGDRNKLRKLYLQRWQRAVKKHGLPVMLNDMIRAGLGTDIDQSVGP